MIRPPGRLAIAGNAARLTRKTPLRSTPTMRSHSSTREGVDVDAVRDRVHAGIVDEDVEPAEGIQRILNRALDAGRVANVHLDRNGLRERGREGLRLWGIDVSDHHGGAVGGKGGGDRPPDAARRAGDNATSPLRSHFTGSPPRPDPMPVMCQYDNRATLRQDQSSLPTHAAASPKTHASISTEAARGDDPAGGDSAAWSAPQPRGPPTLQAAPRHPAGIDRQRLAAVGTPLPREADLAETFQVSLITVRQALRDLETEGLIHKRAAKPAVVADPSTRLNPTFDFRTFGDIAAFTRNARLEVKSYGKERAGIATSYFGLSPRSQVHVLRGVLVSERTTRGRDHDLFSAWDRRAALERRVRRAADLPLG